MATTCSSNISLRIQKVPEYIFVTRTEEQKDEEMMSVDLSRIVTEDTEKSDSEMTAVAALSILVGSPASSPVDQKERTEDEVEEKYFEIPQRLTQSGRMRAVPFTLRLMDVLSRKEYADIIAWTPSGKAFHVTNRKEFTARILPTHFKGTKYSSFTRKLHRWGFSRHYRGEEAGAYHHKHFQKDQLELVEKMTCFKEEGKPFAPPKQEKKTESLAPRPVAPIATREGLADILPPLPSKFLSSMSSWSVNPSIQQSGLMRAPTDLNTAIEMEVSRRLKEQVSAAAMRREALAMMQHQMKPPVSTNTDHYYLPLQQQGGVPSRLIGNNFTTAYQAVAVKERFDSTAADFAATSTGYDQRQRLSNLPSTNILIANIA